MVSIDGVSISKTKLTTLDGIWSCHTRRFNEETHIVDLKYRGDEDLVALRLLVDYARDRGGTNLMLRVAYLPYSSSTDDGNIFAVRSIINMINDMHFTDVEVYEPLDYNMAKMLNNVRIKYYTAKLVKEAMMNILDLRGSAWLDKKIGFRAEETDFSYQALLRKAKENNIYLVYLDSQSYVKYTKQLEYKENVLVCQQTFDKEGEIVGYTLDRYKYTSEYDGGKAIIAHNLCDNSEFITEIAKQLTNMGFIDIRLVAPHCTEQFLASDIFNSELLKQVYTTTSLADIETTDEYHSYNIENTKMTVYS